MRFNEANSNAAGNGSLICIAAHRCQQKLVLTFTPAASLPKKIASCFPIPISRSENPLSHVLLLSQGFPAGSFDSGGICAIGSILVDGICNIVGMY